MSIYENMKVCIQIISLAAKLVLFLGTALVLIISPMRACILATILSGRCALFRNILRLRSIQKCQHMIFGSFIQQSFTPFLLFRSPLNAFSQLDEAHLPDLPSMPFHNLDLHVAWNLNPAEPRFC